MARFANDGMIRIQVVPTISNIAAPTTSELNAGTNISNFVTKDGLTVPSNQNYVDNASLAETFDAQVVGSFGGPVSMTGIKDAVAASDTFWNLIAYGTSTNLVVRRGVSTATAYATSQRVEVYPIQWHEAVPTQTATNEQSRFTAGAAVTSQPNLRAAVA